MATYVNAGISIISAMDLISTHFNDTYLKNVAGQIKEALLQGKPLGSSFARFSDIFPLWHIHIIEYSDKAGRLAEGLQQLADYLEKNFATLQTVIMGLAYPVLLLNLAIFLLPISNIMCCGYFKGLLKIAVPIYGSLALIYMAYHILNSKRHKREFDRFILHIPVIGDVVRKFAMVQFIRALQYMCDAGINITRAWELAADACGNIAFKNAVLKGLPVIERGDNVSAAFIESGVFIPQMVSMIVTGENSGSLVKMLGTVAGYCEKENETTVSVLVKVLPVFVYLLVAAFIAFHVIYFYKSYFAGIMSLR